MTFIPYTTSNSRYSDSKNWSKLLFNKDRKLQTTEIIEIQDLIENQIKKTVKNLYDFYTVIKGCNIVLNNISYNNSLKRYNYLMTGGQVFIELKKVSSFIDLPSFNFYIEEDSTYYVGVNFTVEVLENNTEFLLEELGANYLVIKPKVELFKETDLKQGFYPLAVIKPNEDSVLLPPDIFYYKNKKLTTSLKEETIPLYLKKNIHRVLYETSGDFIAEGFIVNHSKEQSVSNPNLNYLIIKVSPGAAYLQGERIVRNYVLSKRFEFNETLINSIIYIILSSEGKLLIKKVKEEDVNNFTIYPLDLEIGRLIVNEQGHCNYVDSKNRMPSVFDLINFRKQHLKNKSDYLDLALGIDEVLQTKKGNNLKGVLVDSFSSLKNSNTSHPLYNASLVPSIQAITLPFTQFSKDSKSISITNESELKVKRKNRELIWSSVASGNQVVNKTIARTGSVSLGLSSISSANLEVRPNIIYTNNTEEAIGFLPDKVIQNISNNLSTLSNNTNKVIEKELTIEATGFKPNEDNIKLTVDSTVINSAILLEGTESGSLSGTYKANESGHVYLKFLLNIKTSSNTLYVFLESNSRTASNQIKIIDLKESRNEQALSISDCVPKSSSLLAGICSVFTVEEPMSLEAIEIILTEFNNSVSLNRSILDVYLTKSNYGLPTDEVITKGSLKLIDGLPSINSFTLVLFDRIANLSPGEYALTFSSTYENLSLGTYLAGKDTTNTNAPGSFTNSQSSLYKYNQNIWEPLNETLCLKLIKIIPRSLTATTQILVENIEEYNAIELNVPIELTEQSQVSYLINNNLLNNNLYFLPTPAKQTLININTLGSNTNHPIIELDSININLISHKKTGTWVSLNKEFIKAYNLIEVSLDIYNPLNSLFEIYFSSNQGQSWELLTAKNINNEYIYLEDIIEVDKTLPLFNYKFKKEELSFTNFNNETIERTQLMIRVDLIVSNLENLPFFKNLIAITY